MLGNLRMSLLVAGALVGAINHQVAEADSGLKLTYGTFETTQTGIDRDYTITGTALMVRSATDTQVWTQVIGLNGDTSYGSHVHDLPCALGGGGHYKIDPNVAGTVRENEIWPAVETDANGIGFGYDQVDHVARVEAQSIVVHDTDGARIACADLTDGQTGPTTTCGYFETLQAGKDLGLKIRGYAVMRRDEHGTHVVVRVTGLDFGLSENDTYMAHVHDLPADVNTGGPHYKIDPFEPDTIEANEIWPTVKKCGRRLGVGYASVDHIARPEAQSVVIHSPLDGARIAIATLTGPWPTRLVTKGRFTVTADGMALGYENLRGTATMVRDSRGRTTVTVRVNGLDGNETYPAHVHALPCDVQSGGAHYKIDPDIGGAIEENEIWPIVKSNRRGRGRGYVRVRHMARPEAQTVIIHDPVTLKRIACADLYLD